MADIINLAAARATRLTTRLEPAYTDEQLAHAGSIGAQMAESVNSGRVQLGRSPFLGTVEQETALLRRMEAMLVELRHRAGMA